MLLTPLSTAQLSMGAGRSCLIYRCICSGNLVSRMVESRSAWAAVANFAEAMMSHKEQARPVLDHRGET